MPTSEMAGEWQVDRMRDGLRRAEPRHVQEGAAAGMVIVHHVGDPGCFTRTPAIKAHETARPAAQREPCRRAAQFSEDGHGGRL